MSSKTNCRVDVNRSEDKEAMKQQLQEATRFGKSAGKNIPVLVCLLLIANLFAVTRDLVAVPSLPASDPQAETAVADSTAMVTADPLGRSTPRGTVAGYLQKLGIGDMALIAQYFDFSGLEGDGRDAEMHAIVRSFTEQINKNGLFTVTTLISDQATGNLYDGLESNLENVGTIRLQDGTTIPILLERVMPNEEGTELWLISQVTLAQVPVVMDTVATAEATGDTDHAVGAGSIRKITWRGAPVVDWILMSVLLLVSVLLALGVASLIYGLAKKIWKKIGQEQYKKLFKAVFIPVLLLITVKALASSARIIGISIIVRSAFGVVHLSIVWIGLFIFLWLLADTFFSSSEQRLRKMNNFGAISAFLFFRRAFRFLLLGFAFIVILGYFGIDITAGLAALGIGGVALALGAQKMIENLVGSLMIVFDQPVRIGDFCKVGDLVGTVENIGMRSTRIRTLDRTIVSIPNGNLSAERIENFAVRDKFLFQVILGLRYETTVDQMRYLLVSLRSMLYAHPKVQEVPCRVRFLGYGSDALQVEIFSYVTASDYDEYLGIREDINLRIATIIEESGSGFAFPSQTLYMARDGGLSEENTRKAEERVRQWMEQNDLQLPEFDPQTIAKIRDTLDYPEKGSSARR